MTEIASAKDPAPNTDATQPQGQEIALLRAQLVDLANLASVSPRADSAPVQADAPAEIELLRSQLAGLAALLSQPPAAATLPGSGEDAAILAAILKDVLGLGPLPGRDTSAPAQPDIPWAAAEITLLRDTLQALLTEADRARHDDSPHQAAPSFAPQPAAPGMVRVEAALAKLLAELAQETDRRIRAETEAMQARALLRAHGLEDRPAPGRPAVAARRI